MKSQKSPLSKQKKLKKLEPQEGDLVLHKNDEAMALVLKKSKTHSEYYYVFVDNTVEEWHVRNITDRE